MKNNLKQLLQHVASHKVGGTNHQTVTTSTNKHVFLDGSL